MSEHVRPTTGPAVPEQVLWPEQWLFSRTTAPRTGPRDHGTAGPRSRGPVPTPRSGD